MAYLQQQLDSASNAIWSNFDWSESFYMAAAHTYSWVFDSLLHTINPTPFSNDQPANVPAGGIGSPSALTQPLIAQAVAGMNNLSTNYVPSVSTGAPDAVYPYGDPGPMQVHMSMSYWGGGVVSPLIFFPVVDVKPQSR